VAIARIERRVGRTRVYNLAVEGLHTYFVGRVGGGVWVHNARLCPNPNETGPHTVLERNPITGEVTKSAKYVPNPNAIGSRLGLFAGCAHGQNVVVIGA